MNEKDIMRDAFSLAKMGRNRTGTNPMVGAILIKNKKIIGKGFHEEFGGPHAEVNAISDAEKKGHNIKGATLVTTLEPCSHKSKKTPPCTNIIIKKGIKKVFYGSLDINPKVNGRGVAQLKRNNIETTFINFQKENNELNRGYSKIIKKNQPFVTLKICMTLDGMIFNNDLKSNKIGDTEQLKHSNGIRALYDSILIGVNTVIKDNPSLTYRGKGSKDIIQPRPIILDSQLRTPLKSNIIKLQNKPIIFTDLSKESSKENKLRSLGCQIEKVRSLSPRIILNRLAKNNLQSTLIEGGGKVFTNFLKSNMFDELILYYSPSFMGHGGLNISNNLNKKYKLKVKSVSTRKIGNTIMVIYK
ncbi:bifunctional diaminohydroxyphosphoribosylaminopyrimidine deaminase/5-amino-6-(5-phosphoribosylamino)uracil reductase RibD [bacterium]|nr:bifunctional diaminohydroxyphosphoribosylaminopyrimidine deaminase/5-amino-6-(5-phosphoribosylamino)uracil reductase RibD [bacterium]|tara:strand:- start:6198 stop:7271 length:1074 start_codon:yes stop_codon:yes gene_type:complete